MVPYAGLCETKADRSRTTFRLRSNRTLLETCHELRLANPSILGQAHGLGH